MTLTVTWGQGDLRSERESMTRSSIAVPFRLLKVALRRSLFGRPKELVAVEVDHVVRVLGNPDFRLPRDVVDVPPELFEIREGRDVDALGRARLECSLHFELALRRYRAVRGHDFDEAE